ncbi:UNVERIFIED_ORG: hypothetical protein J2X74_006111 [Bacillus sp. 1751]|nr:hypothetical protein [Bacillus sp. 1751]
MAPQEYQVIFYTGREDGAGTNADIYLTILGTFGDETFKMPDNRGNDTENGYPEYYTITAHKNLGDVYQLHVQLEKTDNDSPDWYLSRAEISTNIAGKQYNWEFPAGCWIFPGDAVAYLTPFGVKDQPDGVIVITKGKPKDIYLAMLKAAEDAKKKEEENKNNT